MPPPSRSGETGDLLRLRLRPRSVVRTCASLLGLLARDPARGLDARSLCASLRGPLVPDPARGLDGLPLVVDLLARPCHPSPSTDTEDEPRIPTSRSSTRLPVKCVCVEGLAVSCTSMGGGSELY